MERELIDMNVRLCARPVQDRNELLLIIARIATDAIVGDAA
jgi:hypothetical protein